MTLLEFSNLKEMLISSFENIDHDGSLFKLIKKSYERDINSPRRYEQINSLSDLLEVLEIRDVISENDVKPLVGIAKRVNDANLLNKLQDYENRHTFREQCYYNEIKDELVQTSNTNYFSHVNSNPYPAVSDKKLERINEKISAEIGSYWHDLARNLGLREGIIDEIEATQGSLKSKAESVLDKYYTSLADQQQWFFVLCEALEKSRRKDLSRSLQNIMMMNI